MSTLFLFRGNVRYGAVRRGVGTTFDRILRIPTKSDFVLLTFTIKSFPYRFYVKKSLLATKTNEEEKNDKLVNYFMSL